MFRNNEIARAPQIVASISPIPKRKRVGNQACYKLFVGMLGAGESVKFIQLDVFSPHIGVPLPLQRAAADSDFVTYSVFCLNEENG
jgi:hypothetical protein